MYDFIRKNKIILSIIICTNKKNKKETTMNKRLLLNIHSFLSKKLAKIDQELEKLNQEIKELREEIEEQEEEEKNDNWWKE